MHLSLHSNSSISTENSEKEIRPETNGDERDEDRFLTIEPLFCCQKIYPIKDPATEVELGIYHFISLISDPSTSHLYIKKYPTTLLLDCWLCDINLIIEYVNFEKAEKAESRYFFLQPDLDDSEFQIVEMEEGVVNWDVWRKNWECVKWRCDEHMGDRHWWTIRLLERIDLRAEAREVLAVQRSNKGFDPIFVEEWKAMQVAIRTEYAGEA